MEKEILREVARVHEPYYLRKSADRKVQTSKGFCSAHRTDLCFATCRISQVVFITSSKLTHNLFFYFH